VFKDEMELFEAAVIDQIFAPLEPGLCVLDDEPEEVVPVFTEQDCMDMCEEPDFDDDILPLDSLLAHPQFEEPPRICHECQSKPCRCREFAGRALLEAALMDNLMRIEDDYEDSLDNTCGTCHNWPCVCGTEEF